MRAPAPTAVCNELVASRATALLLLTSHRSQQRQASGGADGSGDR
jgi:hypothetical protein